MKPMPDKVRLFKCELCGLTSPSMHGINVHIGHINKGLKKPEVLVEDESSDLVNAETVENSESELGDTCTKCTSRSFLSVPSVMSNN